jgi:hypothetical protein
MDEDARPLSPRLIEPILRQQPIIDYIEAFSWVTRDLRYSNVGVSVDAAEVQDFSRLHKFKTGVFGIVPSLINATHTEVFEVNHIDESTGLTIFEQLFTARGSQSMGTGHMMPRMAGVNVSDHKQTMLLELKGKPRNRVYEVRPLFTMNQAPGFTMIDHQRMSFGDDSILMSLPMYATIG